MITTLTIITTSAITPGSTLQKERVLDDAKYLVLRDIDIPRQVPITHVAFLQSEWHAHA